MRTGAGSTGSISQRKCAFGPGFSGTAQASRNKITIDNVDIFIIYENYRQRMTEWLQDDGLVFLSIVPLHKHLSVLSQNTFIAHVILSQEIMKYLNIKKIHSS